ncbi:MAG: GNAT family N-acetyltransferase [Saprospiraceae bacterium]|nr:GNAT family N-acetyltransferase [Saprospiraceae bacterium]MBK7796250.1 GNAT family N-acetyltransferase [Saprospiraceae bacterium]MBL0260357.1 GNAT family N-acetyltransferase [Saprospiraceae bacterium]
MQTISYQVEEHLSVEEFFQVLQSSTLADRRPVGEPDRLGKMLEHANLIITARHGDKLVGIARSMTDFVYCTYLSELAVDIDYQKKGIGKELIRITKERTPKAKLILLAAPNAVNYYPRIGMKHWNQCYVLDQLNELV